MKELVAVFFKGVAMGAANVIPGVSGGTIALITGIFERLIDAIKSFNFTALRLLLKADFKGFAKHTDLLFLLALFLGVAVSILSFARIFDFLFKHYPVYIWSFFFGLILASVFFVGKTVSRWSWDVIFVFIIGFATAMTITFLNPATQNESLIYLIVCGIIAACSMILPGLSGSFVLILLGNYQLVMIDSINQLRFDILIPIVFGALVGLLGFSYLLSWVFKKYRNQTIAILTGFIFGSLGIIWPWKEMIIQQFGDKEKVVGYNWLLPELNLQFLLAIVIMLFGVLSIWFMEHMAEQKDK
ncbi:MAG: DUF368 domain-containing protein [Bacteroidales bacterium]|nr:DUF368 domain-containing protein [Bacteroidales bacterium]